MAPDRLETHRPRERSGRGWLLLGVASLALFATGIGPRPAGAAWAFGYDVVAYNLVYLAGAVVSAQAARRSTTERWAWAALSVALLMSSVGNLLYSLVVARLDPQPYPSVADVFYLGYFLPLYVALVGLIRARVRRFHTSMWLDGLIGGLGATAIAVAFLLGPALALTEGTPAAVVTSLAYPLADVLLLAVLAAAGAILGLRGDRTMLLMAAGISVSLVGDVVYLELATRDVYVEGGPLDLTWLVAVTLMVLAAHTGERVDATEGPADSSPTARVGWRVLAVPLVFNLASLGVLAAGVGNRFSPVAAWCAIGCVLAALARTAVTFREVRAFNEVKQQATTDELTGLPNRRALLAAAGAQLAVATAQRPAALLLLDLDGFKEVNDSLGHHAGDELLRQVGPRLRRGMRGGDVLARLGGDEFAVLLRDADLAEAQRQAERLCDLLAEPFVVESIRLHVGVSIGVATAPVPAATVAELLRCADVAMYTAKAGREGVRVYVPDPTGGTGDRLKTMEDLRTALTVDDQLLVHLQPQVDLASRQVVGAEALVRWQHPERGLLSPAELLPAAEQAGLLRPLTDLVLELSLAAAAQWWSERQVPVSVNLSAANVTDLDLPSKVALALLRHGLPAAALTLELVEDTLMADPERGRRVLGELRRLGVRTSIDDYGTGYSSLAYLRHLPADELKLDRSLTVDITSDPRAAAIVRHTVALAHDLGLTLVAEGIEDDASAAALASLGCDVGQGWLFARPMPLEDFLDHLRTQVPGRIHG